MEPPGASSLETLPLLVIERICEYLTQADDDLAKRRSLWAFSLTSRSCCAVAAAQRFCQIQLKVLAPDELESQLRRWTEVLCTNGCFRYVRRLKVLRVTPEKERQILRLTVAEQDEEGEEYQHRDDITQRDYFDMHDFCRPSQVSIRCEEGNFRHHPEAWQPLAQFISQLSALTDLVWACGSRMPGYILSAVHAIGCRLHVHCFRLPSLVQHRDRPQPIDRDEYALATSPSLSSIAVSVYGFDGNGLVEYTEEAVMRMVGGIVPRLAHVRMNYNIVGDSLSSREAFRLGKPAWSGFFPGTAEPDKLPVLGSLRSLVLTCSINQTKLDNWSRSTDFAKLRRLTIPWDPQSCIALAEMAMRGDFESLHTLGLLGIVAETHQVQEALNRLLGNLNPLQQLDFGGSISEETFNIVLRRHGGTLRKLSVYLYRDEESQFPLVVFSEAVVQRLAEQCPNLEQVELPIDRTRGDDRETGTYRALSRVPRLKRAFLKLRFSVGPDNQRGEEVREGEPPICTEGGGGGGETIHFVYLREAFSNSAIDSTLALSIFNLISSGGSLRYLRLTIDRKAGQNEPGIYQLSFRTILRWFARNWVCKWDAQGRATVRELDKLKTIQAGEKWKDNEDWPGWEEEVYQKAFNDIWPQKTAEWWKDWKSLPLSDGSA
jgi:hypothetical protein